VRAAARSRAALCVAGVKRREEEALRRATVPAARHGVEHHTAAHRCDRRERAHYEAVVRFESDSLVETHPHQRLGSGSQLARAEQPQARQALTGAVVQAHLGVAA
jgi:hypothetical protein